MIRSTKPVWVASSMSSSRPPPERWSIASPGTPARVAAAAGELGEHRVRARRRARPAQDGRVPRLQAQRRSVDGDVRARLVDDRDDAERHADPADLQAARAAEAVEDLADGVGQRRDGAGAGRHRGDPPLVEREAVDERIREPGVAARVDVLAVGVDDLRRVASSADAIASSAASLTAVSRVARVRAARRAARQISSTDAVALTIRDEGYASTK